MAVTGPPIFILVPGQSIKKRAASNWIYTASATRFTNYTSLYEQNQRIFYTKTTLLIFV